MMRSPVRSLALAIVTLFSAIPVLSAQEPPAPRPGGPPEIVRERIPDGRVELLTTRRARLGVVLNLRVSDTDSIGALIQSVTPNGPAARAGIRSGDIITRVNGQPLVAGNVKSGRDQSAPGLALTLLSAGLKPGDSVVVQYRRGKDRRNATVVAGDEPGWTWNGPGEPGNVYLESPDPFGPLEMDPRTMTMRVFADTLLRRPGHLPIRTPMPRIFMLGSPLADLELAPLNPELGRYFGTDDGVLVINVPDSSRLGLKPGDVVFSVDGRRVASPPQLLRILQSYEPGEEYRLEIMRMKKRETVTGSVAER
jgi:S1-C subfamily serine protease